MAGTETVTIGDLPESTSLPSDALMVYRSPSAPPGAREFAINVQRVLDSQTDDDPVLTDVRAVTAAVVALSASDRGKVISAGSGSTVRLPRPGAGDNGFLIAVHNSGIRVSGATTDRVIVTLAGVSTEVYRLELGGQTVVLMWDGTGWIRIAEPGGGGGSGGLTQAQVDARIQARVEDFAETGNAAQIPTGKLADDSVTQDKVADDAIGGRELRAEAVATGHIADNAVTGRKIPSNTITAAHIATDAVDSAEIRGEAVGTSELADGGVTEAKLDSAARAKLNDRGSGGLDTAAVDARIAPYARAVPTGTIADAQIPGEITRDTELDAKVPDIPSGSEGQNKVLKTDAAGAPGWRDEAGGGVSDVVPVVAELPALAPEGWVRFLSAAETLPVMEQLWRSVPGSVAAGRITVYGFSRAEFAGGITPFGNAPPAVMGFAAFWVSGSPGNTNLHLRIRDDLGTATAVHISGPHPELEGNRDQVVPITRGVTETVGGVAYRVYTSTSPLGPGDNFNYSSFVNASGNSNTIGLGIRFGAEFLHLDGTKAGPTTLAPGYYAAVDGAWEPVQVGEAAPGRKLRLTRTSNRVLTLPSGYDEYDLLLLSWGDGEITLDTAVLAGAATIDDIRSGGSQRIDWVRTARTLTLSTSAITGALLISAGDSGLTTAQVNALIAAGVGALDIPVLPDAPAAAAAAKKYELQVPASGPATWAEAPEPGDDLTDDAVLDLAKPARTASDRGKFLGTATGDENDLALLDAPTGGGGLDQAAVDARIETKLPPFFDISPIPAGIAGGAAAADYPDRIDVVFSEKQTSRTITGVTFTIGGQPLTLDTATPISIIDAPTELHAMLRFGITSGTKTNLANAVNRDATLLSLPGVITITFSSGDPFTHNFAWLVRNESLGGSTALTDDAVLDLAQSSRAAADRGKVLGTSATNENALALTTPVEVTEYSNQAAAEAATVGPDVVQYWPGDGGSGSGSGTPLSDDAVLDLAKPTRTSSDRGKFLGTAAGDENDLVLLDAPTGGGGGGLTQSQVDARIADYARAAPSGTIADAQIPQSIARDTEVAAAVQAEASTRAAADTALGRRIDGIPAAPAANRLVPSGGAAGQVLKKDSTTDYDVSWQDDEAGSGGGLSEAQVDARIATYARATPTGTIPDAQIPAGITRDTELDARIPATAAERIPSSTTDANRVWKTDATGRPGWRPDATGMGGGTAPAVTVGELTDAAAITWDADAANVADVTITADRLLSVPTGGVDGGIYMLRVKQGTGGNKDLVLNSNIDRGDHAAPALSVTAGDVDLLLFTRYGALWKYLGILKGYRSA